MNDMFKDITSVAMAIVGVAIIAVLVSQNSQTTSVVGAVTGGFAQALKVAMGGASGNATISMTGS